MSIFYLENEVLFNLRRGEYQYTAPANPCANSINALASLVPLQPTQRINRI